jgi:phospholipid/cholesterol/gamma-HCH transport system substrate-binding protein
MPTGPRTVVVRVSMIVALVAGAALVAVLVLGASRTSYQLNVVLENASQLVKGNRVSVGGVPVGSVKDIRLDDHNRAVVVLEITDPEIAPVHEGTRAVVRATSLSGVANRYVAIEPGPNNARPIPDGGAIPEDRTQSSVDLDEILNSLDYRTRQGLSTFVRSSSEQYSGEEEEANKGLEALNPALSQVAATTAEIDRDEDALSRAIIESAAVVSAVADRDPQLESGIQGAATTLSAVAGQRGSLDAVLANSPAVLRRANTTLVNLRATFGDVRPALREARPAAAPLAGVLRVAAPLARDARPTVADVRALVPDADAALRGLPATQRAATPAFTSATKSLKDALPVVQGVRPYVPDTVAGLINGFGGTAGGYYDANGHYARISFQGGPYSINGDGSLLTLPSADGSLSGYRKGLLARCPGAAAQPAADQSSPWTDSGASCRAEDSPK